MKKKEEVIGFFERYLTLWVALCIVAGIAVGQLIPAVPDVLGSWEYANVSIPIAVLIWLMIYPMMLKVDFQSVKNVGKRPKGILVTCVTNWLIKPFTMFAIAWAFFFVFFKNRIPTDLAGQYLAGVVLLGAAPCTAMVFVWNSCQSAAYPTDSRAADSTDHIYFLCGIRMVSVSEIAARCCRPCRNDRIKQFLRAGGRCCDFALRLTIRSGTGNRSRCIG